MLFKLYILKILSRQTPHLFKLLSNNTEQITPFSQVWHTRRFRSLRGNWWM